MTLELRIKRALNINNLLPKKPENKKDINEKITYRKSEEEIIEFITNKYS